MIPKIAFLFLTITNIYHESYWRDFLDGHTAEHSMYIHASEGVPEDSPFKKYELPYTIPTTHYHTMKAQIALLKEALRDPDNQKFIFSSESTIPLQSFKHVYSEVMDTHKSIFKYFPNPHQDPENKHYATRSLEKLPQEYRYKSSQWIILNRAHATLMANDTQYLDIITEYDADNELYPSSFLATQHALNEVDCKRTTFVNWDKRNPETMPRAFPYVYTNLHDPEQLSDIKHAIQEGFLFARKIESGTDLSPLDTYLAYKP